METIDLNNYEKYLLDYADGELEPAREAELLKFLEAHPALRQELALLEAARLQPDESIVFPEKQSLYRESSGARIIRSRWWIAAAAAALILLLYLPGTQEEVPVAGHLPVAATAPAPSRSLPPSALPHSLPADTPSSLRPAAVSPGTASARILPAAAPVREEEPSGEQHPAKKAGVAERDAGQMPVPAPTAPSPPVVTLSGISNEVSGIRDQGSGIHDQGSRIKDQAPSPEEGSSGLFGRAKSFTDSAGTLAMKTEVALADAKERLDDGITDKITGLQDRISHPFRELKGKKIRIGRLEIAMNN